MEDDLLSTHPTDRANRFSPKTLNHQINQHTLAASAARVIIMALAVAVAAGAQTVSTVAVFDGKNGNDPMGTLMQGLDGNLYGTTEYGGRGQIGNVFQLSPQGVLDNVHSLCPKYPECMDGAVPWGGLVLATNGNYYGTTTDAFWSNNVFPGTVFELEPGGEFKTLLFFTGANGEIPLSSLVQARDGNLYGTGNAGGDHSEGTVFKMTLSGELTTLYSFCAKQNCADGEFPNAITQGRDGNFYGTTLYGGTGAYCASSGTCGTVFKITPGGKLTTLYSFCSLQNCADGAFPTGNVIQGEDGNLYGATDSGGTGQYCVPSTPVYTCGTFFKLTPDGILTTLYSFCSVGANCLDGSSAYGGIVEGTDGNFYGTTWQGGMNSSRFCFNGNSGCGTVYRVTPAGVMTTVYNFCSAPECADGFKPLGRMMQATNGLIYGTTYYGGNAAISGGVGTVFSIDAGMRPFVQPVVNAGVVGTDLIILGNNLTASSAVRFGGVPAATFTVVSSTEITATVPAGAKSGRITVTTPGGTLKSNGPFYVTQ